MVACFVNGMRCLSDRTVRGFAVAGPARLVSRANLRRILFLLRGEVPCRRRRRIQLVVRISDRFYSERRSGVVKEGVSG